MSFELRRLYRKARLLGRFIFHEELKNNSSISISKRIFLVFNGFLSKWHEIYNQKDYKLKDYFSDWQKAKMSLMYWWNPRAGYAYGLNNKIFSTALLGCHLKVPTIYAIIQRGLILPLGNKENKCIGSPWIEACRSAGDVLVFKPIAGRAGIGVFFLCAKDGMLTYNDSPMSENDVEEIIKGLDEYMIVEYVRQGEYGTHLYPHTTNTIRAITFIEPATSKPTFFMAVQRIGNKKSQPIDNLEKGGMCAEIDVETGILGPAASCQGPDYHLNWFECHPETNKQISGIKVPRWNQIKQEILDAASNMPFYKYLSWDVVTQDDGIYIIEADTVSGTHVLQIHRPLLRETKFKRFMEYYGII